MRPVKRIIKICLCAVVIFSCQQHADTFSESEKKQVETEVIASIEKHVHDIISRDYNKVMTFYVKEGYTLFGDGTYWGDYKTVDDIWGTWLPKWRAITSWELKNHKVNVFSKDAAVDYVEWEHERIEENGDTTKAYGFWVWGMQRYPDGWKSISAAIDHRYTAGPNVKK